jgi:Ser/Thr protein kinase RdoA (MazF antagonist)
VITPAPLGAAAAYPSDVAAAETGDGQALPGLSVLLDHLDRVLDAQVVSVDELDAGVFRIGRAASPDWVMRVFPRDRAMAEAEGDAAILRRLGELDFPAERPIDRMPVSQVAGHPVLVTGYVEAAPRDPRRDTIKAAGGLRSLGDLLGRMGAFECAPEPFARPGGAWHHLAEGHPREELGAARVLLDDLGSAEPGGSRRHIDALRAALDTADDGEGLPEAFVHPDFVLANVVATPDPAMVIVDWTGAGRGPRAWPLAFLLWTEARKDARRADLVLAGYAPRVTLQADELARLPGLLRARPLVFAALRLRDADIGASEASALSDAVMTQSEAVAARARRVLESLAR